MAGVGGYQPPSIPAPASGPGRLARRTDGGPAQKLTTTEYTNLPYGDKGALVAQQRGAPMRQADPVEPAPIVGLHEPTARPDEPVTAGIDSGPGPGSEAIGPPGSDYGTLADLLGQLAGADVSGSIAALLAEARSRGI
jgi:hypothetical protein